MLTIGEPIGTVEVKLLTSQTKYKFGVECDTVAVLDQRVLFQARMEEIRVGLLLLIQRSVS